MGSGASSFFFGRNHMRNIVGSPSPGFADDASLSKIEGPALSVVEGPAPSIGSMEIDPFSTLRDVPIDQENGLYTAKQPKSQFYVCTTDSRLAGSVVDACKQESYDVEHFRSIAELQALFDEYKAYMKHCREIINDSVERQRKFLQPLPVEAVPRPSHPYPHVVLVDFNVDDGFDKSLDKFASLKKTGGRAAAGSCFVAVLPPRDYTPKLVKAIMSKGFHSVLRQDSLWPCELVQLDMGAARDRFIIEESQIAFDAIHRSPVSCEFASASASLQYVNPRFEDMFGYSNAAAKNETPKTLLRSHVNDDVANHFRAMDNMVASNQAWMGSYFSRDSKEQHFPISALICPHPRLHGTPMVMGMKMPVTLPSLQRVALHNLATSSGAVFSALLNPNTPVEHLAATLASVRSTGGTGGTEHGGNSTKPVNGGGSVSTDAVNARGPVILPPLNGHQLNSGGGPIILPPLTNQQRNSPATMPLASDPLLAGSVEKFHKAKQFVDELLYRSKNNKSMYDMVDDYVESILAHIQETGSAFHPDFGSHARIADQPEFVHNYVSADPSPPKSVKASNDLSVMFNHVGICFQAMTWAEYDARLNNIPAEARRTIEDRKIWHCDVIQLERVTEGHGPLFWMGMSVCRDFGVCEFLKIGEDILACWLTLMELNYRKDVTYHTSTHAADVLQATSFFLLQGKLSTKIITRDQVCLLIAAIVHDLGHAGVSNTFLTATDNALASLYMDQSVLEHYHSSLSWELSVKYAKCNIYQGIVDPTQQVMQHRINDLVLSTDMHCNDRIVSSFSCIPNVDAAITPNTLGNAEKVNISVARTQATDLLLRMIIKAADLCNSARPVRIGKPWSFRIAEEFVRQSDMEIPMGVSTVFPIFTRKGYNLPKSQSGFINYIVAPMYAALGSLLPLESITSDLKDNVAYWTAEEGNPEDYPPVEAIEATWDPHVFKLHEFMRDEPLPKGVNVRRQSEEDSAPPTSSGTTAPSAAVDADSSAAFTINGAASNGASAENGGGQSAAIMV